MAQDCSEEEVQTQYQNFKYRYSADNEFELRLPDKIAGYEICIFRIGIECIWCDFLRSSVKISVGGIIITNTRSSCSSSSSSSSPQLSFLSLTLCVCCIWMLLSICLHECMRLSFIWMMWCDILSFVACPSLRLYFYAGMDNGTVPGLWSVVSIRLPQLRWNFVT